MSSSISHKVKDALGVELLSSESLGGGCIANTQKLNLCDGRVVLCKSGTAADSFRKEANGLIELAKAKCIRIPEVLFWNDEMLLMEYIPQGRKGDHFFEKFGESFAKMHLYKSAKFGFFEDNFIGATIQKNDVTGIDPFSWTEFYFKKRLYFQYQLACKNGYDDGTLTQLIGKLEEKIELIIADDEIPALLHGDLWGGNFLISEEGAPVLIDPAVYYGHREADLAMTSLFGGFGHAFYEAYQHTYPLKDGWEFRQGIYQLYHVLNHLNLFGSGYYSQSISLLKKYV